MIKTSIEQLSEAIGFDIGNSDNHTQANLLNGLSRGINMSCGKGGYDIQLVYIAKELSLESQTFIKELYETIKTMKEEK